MQHHELTDEQIVKIGRKTDPFGDHVQHQATFLLLARGKNRAEIAHILQVGIDKVTTMATVAPMFGWTPGSAFGDGIIEHLTERWGERNLAESVTREVDRLSVSQTMRHVITDFSEPPSDAFPEQRRQYRRVKKQEDERRDLRLMELDHADAAQVVRGVDDTRRDA